MRIIKKPLIQPRTAEELAEEARQNAASSPQPRENSTFLPPIGSAIGFGSTEQWNAARQQRRQAPLPESSNKRRKLSGTDGYNSDDEYVSTHPSSVTRIQHGDSFMVLNEAEFEADLRQRRGFEIYRVSPDGNCLFRSVADQVYGDENMHDEVRRLVVDYMEKERDYFSQFVTEEFADYIARKRQNRTYGNHLELQAVAELYNRPIEIFAQRPEPMNLFHTDYDAQNPPIRLSYHNGNHYNSIRDPNNPAVGVGLGLPAYDPSLADKLQLDSAMKESESIQVEQQIISQALKQSEADADSESILKAGQEASELEFAEKELQKAVMKESLGDALAQALKAFGSSDKPSS